MGAAQGYNPMQIAGILGRTGVESGYQTNGPAGDNGTAFGAQQWRGSRKLALMDTASKMNLPWTDPKVQATHLFNELGSTEKASGEALRAATTPEDIQNVVSGYERPQGYTPKNPRGASGYDQALANANEIAKAIGAGQGTGETTPISGQMSDMSKTGGQDSGGDLGSSLLGLSSALAARDNPQQAAQMRSLMAKEGKSQVVGFSPDHSGVVTYDPTTNTTTTVPVSGGIVGKGGAGDNSVSTDLTKDPPTPEELADAKQIASYQTPMPVAYSNRSPGAIRLRHILSTQYPDFQAQQYKTAQKTMDDVATGKLGVANNALETVAGHLDDLDAAAEALNNGNIHLVNTIANKYGQATGTTPQVVVNAIQKGISDEMMKVYRGGGAPSEKEAADFQKIMDPNASPQQIKATIGAFSEMLQAKIEANTRQYTKGVGKTRAAAELLFHPEMQAVLDRLQDTGQDTEDQPNATKQQGASGPLPVTNVTDYAKVPSGTQYIGPDGQIRTKR